MIEADKAGSGREFLNINHDMIRVFDYLLNQAGINFGVKWDAKYGKPSGSKWVRNGDGRPCYVPEALWNLDDPEDLPQEIRALFSYADSHYLKEVFAGVKARVEYPHMYDDPVDELGRFIERGVKSGPPGAGGFNTAIQDYLDRAGG